MKKKALSIAILLIALICGIVSAVNGQTYDKCPPNKIGEVQPPYSGKKGGYDGWWSSDEVAVDNHKVRMWGLDIEKNVNEKGEVIGGGDERFVLFFDDKPVGQCPSNGGYNKWWCDKYGTVYHHYESKDPNDKAEWDENKWDGFIYNYFVEEDELIVEHVEWIKEGEFKVIERLYDGAPPEKLSNLPPDWPNMTRTEQSTVEYTPLLRAVGGIVIPVDKLALLVPYIGLTSTIIVATVATAVYVKRVKRRKEKQ